MVQVLALAVEDAYVGAEELVGAACQEIAVQRFDVDQAVRRVLHSVHEGIGLDFLGPTDYGLDIVDRAAGVAGIADCDQLGAGGDEGAQVLHVQRAGFDVDVGPLYRGAGVLGHHHPGADVGVVVEASDDDLVARAELVG